MSKGGLTTSQAGRITPSRMAHFVLRANSNTYSAAVDWYRELFLADTVFSNDQITFLAFDNEHHRLAIIHQPELSDAREDVAGIDHVAFSYDTLGSLLLTYERLLSIGVVPRHTINHGPTTSFYYLDPIGSMVELQVDNFPTVAEAWEFFHSTDFANNFVGIFIDANKLMARWRDNVPVADLLDPRQQTNLTG